MKYRLGGISLLIGLVLSGCSEPTTPRLGGRASNYAELPSLSEVASALADPQESDGRLIVVLKRPSAPRGLWRRGFPSLQARRAAERAVRAAFPALQVYEGVDRYKHVLTPDGPTQIEFHTNALLIEPPAGEARLQALANHPAVEFIVPNSIAEVEVTSSAPRVAPRLNAKSYARTAEGDSMAWGIRAIRADSVWELYGYPGDFVNVDIVDTGWDGALVGGFGIHPDFDSHRVRITNLPFWEFDLQSGKWYSVYTDNNCGLGGFTASNAPPCFFEDPFHGSGVLGLAVAEADGMSAVGVAPMDNELLEVCHVTYVRTDGETVTSRNAWHECTNAIGPFENGNWLKFSAVSIYGEYWHDIEQIFWEQDLTDNVIWVASLGNRPNDPRIPMPASFPTVIKVGSLDGSGRRYVSPPHPDALYAPAVAQATSWNRNDSDPPYVRDRGKTSAAVGLVAGAVALVWDFYPSQPAWVIETMLKQHARDIGPIGPDAEYGYGMVDVLCTIEQNPSCPRVNWAQGIVAPPPLHQPDPLSVQVGGPITIYPSSSYTWTAEVSGGTTPYSYTWSRKDNDGSSQFQVIGHTDSYTGADNSVPMCYGFDLRLEVESDDGQSASETITVSTISNPNDDIQCIVVGPPLQSGE